jgi:hypothetical protein
MPGKNIAMIRQLLTFAVILLLTASLSAQQAAPADAAPAQSVTPSAPAPAAPDAQPATAKTLNNDAVIKLVKAGLSDDLIVTTINASAGNYDTSADGVIALKAAGGSDKVVSALVVKASAPPPAPQTAPAIAAAPAPPPAPVATDPDDPASPHDAGIYYFDSKASAGSKMKLLEPSVFGQNKTGGLFTSAMTYGIAKASTKEVLRNAHSNARVSDPNTVFYFYFEEKSAGLSNSQQPFSGTSTPNEYTLLRFDVKKDSRETTTGKFNAYGASGGTDQKAAVAFTYSRIKAGVYKVTLSAPLTKGEYGFMSPSGGLVVGSMMGGATVSGTSRVFDFGVD